MDRIGEGGVLDHYIYDTEKINAGNADQETLGEQALSHTGN